MKNVLLFVGLSLCNLVSAAQTVNHTRLAHTTEKSAIHVPAQEAPKSLKKIYSNLGTSSTDLYFDTDGGFVTGPNALYYGLTYSGALRFTPKTNSTVTQVQVAVQYLDKGANQVNLSIYGDTASAPGTLLASPVTVTNPAAFGTCCTLTVANFSPVAVTGGTQYWVVADAPLTGPGSDFVGAWDFVAKVFPMAFDDGAGWVASTGDDVPAGEVLGSIP